MTQLRVQAGARIWTYQDVVEHLLDVEDVAFDALEVDRNRRQARRAVIRAYSELFHMRLWAYAHQRLKIDTVTQYEAGTVTYDHTGGASARLATFSAGTLPSDAEFRTLLINNIHYEIDKYIDASNVTLMADSNPGVDVAASSFIMYRDSYPLPPDVIRLGEVTDVTAVNRVLEYVPPNEFLQRSRGYITTSWPWYYTFTRDENYMGSLAIRFGQPPNIARTYDVMAQVRGRALRYERHTTGTVSVSLDGSTVTGVGSAFSSNMIGSHIRLSVDGENLPTSVIGDIDGIDNQATHEAIILEVASTTSLTISEAAPAALASVKFVISDPIDMEEGAMFDALLRLAESQMANFLSRKNYIEKRQLAMQAVALAADYDARSYAPTTNGHTGSRLRDTAQNIDVSVN